ncbi:MAG TPA: isochorismatase family cysteine hydrolase [Thermohalobaculum sp.]|nr:isochorismatase family cysteine hydrolase [Thermohalobaculum sp.]
MTDQPAADYIQEYMTARAPDRARAALVIVDMQYASGSRDGALGRRMRDERSNLTDYRFDRIERLVVPNILRLAPVFRAGGGEVVYITQGAERIDCADAPPHMRKFYAETGNHVGSREHEILDELAPEPRDFVVNKRSIGAFASTGIDHLLRSLGREQLYVTGISTNMCVETTAREAADRGYAVTLVEDACATTHADLHEGTIRNFARLFGRVRSTEEVLGELG